MAARYTEVIKQKWEAKESLQKLLDADPEVVNVEKAKFEVLGNPVLFITLAQGLDDPLLRPALMESWGDFKVSSAFYYAVDNAASQFGYQRQDAKATPEGLAALLKKLEPHFQADYQRLLEKMQVNQHHE